VAKPYFGFPQRLGFCLNIYRNDIFMWNLKTCSKCLNLVPWALSLFSRRGEVTLETRVSTQKPAIRKYPEGASCRASGIPRKRLESRLAKRVENAEKRSRRFANTPDESMTEKSRTINQWYASFEKAKDFDSWGQLVEAADEYAR